MGRVLQVQYPDGKEVSYTYGKIGERTSITYPDGGVVSYIYDSQMRLAALKDSDVFVKYAYDDKGRLAHKSFTNGMVTTYAYNVREQLSELTHQDKKGIIDRYTYGYDLMGNKTSIEKQRKGLIEESGLYTYEYDALGRLKKVIKDNQFQRAYKYDAFGNRINLKERNNETVYTYNACSQLISKTDNMNKEIYAYDKRGNLNFIMEEGSIKKQYTYGVQNRLEYAANDRGERAIYEYNGLGHRVGKRIEDIALKRQVKYTIDITRGYHNLLEKEENAEGKKTQYYFWDNTVVGVRNMESREGDFYYFQDDQGSPIRLMDQEGSIQETYGYDEFGKDLYGDADCYDNKKSLQLFGYTGYQVDKTADSYFAQAREYSPDLGRFAAIDIIGGSLFDPQTQNPYEYCLNQPFRFTDPTGCTEESDESGCIEESYKITLEEIMEANTYSYLIGGLNIMNAASGTYL